MEQLDSHWTYLNVILYLTIFENLSKKFKLHYNLTRIMCTLHEDQYILLIIFHPVLLRIRNVSDKNCRKNQTTHFMINNFFSGKSAVYEIMWKISVEPDWPQMII